MTSTDIQFLNVGPDDSKRRIAYLSARGAASKPPGFIWLQGLKSELVSTKATALAKWCGEHNHACTRFDYSGHGRSDGRFEDGATELRGIGNDDLVPRDGGRRDVDEHILVVGAMRYLLA